MAVHVERATLEDLTGIWEIHALVGGEPAERQLFVRAVEERACLVAKAGWAVRGYAVRRADFLGYPLLTHLAAHPDHAETAITEALLAYAERTVIQDRIFAVMQADDDTTQRTYQNLGYVHCGEINGLLPGREAATFYVKYLSPT